MVGKGGWLGWVVWGYVVGYVARLALNFSNKLTLYAIIVTHECLFVEFSGDSRVELVVLCGQRPTRSLLDFVGDNLLAKLTWLEGQSEESEGSKHPEQLSNGGSQSSPKYNVVKAPEEAAIIVNVDGKTAFI